MLIVIVGSFGLASNILGLLLFHGKLPHLSLFPHTLITLILEHAHSHETPPPPKPVIPPSGSSHPNPIPSSHGPIDIPSRSRSPSYSEFSSSLYGHPAATRASLVQTAHEIALGTSPAQRSLSLHKESSSHSRPPVLEQNIPSDESAPLLPQSPHHSHSHSHAGSMNMRALVLHVIGDALGNVGVIATGLIDRKSTRLNSSHLRTSRMPSSA